MKEERYDHAGKGDGKPYLEMMEEEYSKMSDAEKEEIDKYGEKLRKIFAELEEAE